MAKKKNDSSGIGCLVVIIIVILGGIYSAFSSLYSYSIPLFILVINIIITIIALIAIIYNIRKQDSKFENTYYISSTYLPSNNKGDKDKLKLYGVYSGVVLISLLVPLSIILFAIIWYVYKNNYFKSEKYKNIIFNISDNTNRCNEFNDHIDELKDSGFLFNKRDYGQASYQDKSQYNFQRRARKDYVAPEEEYRCSLSVLKNSCEKPFKYICKYFDIKKDEETLGKLQDLLNNLSAVTEGKNLLLKERNVLFESVYKKLPLLIRRHAKAQIAEDMGIYTFNFNEQYYPQYVFSYVSAGGNSSQENRVILDLNMLERFIKYMSDEVKYKKSAKSQRALMTVALREEIKKRDDYTCKKCGNSTYKEPNLLLEIDHIIPISKGGESNKDNLQTLCWKCNRAKGAKIE